MSFVHVNSATEAAEKLKKDIYASLCAKRGMLFVPVVFTPTGGIGAELEFQRSIWNPYWKQVEEDDSQNGNGHGNLGARG